MNAFGMAIVEHYSNVHSSQKCSIQTERIYARLHNCLSESVTLCPGMDLGDRIVKMRYTMAHITWPIHNKQISCTTLEAPESRSLTHLVNFDMKKKMEEKSILPVKHICSIHGWTYPWLIPRWCDSLPFGDRIPYSSLSWTGNMSVYYTKNIWCSHMLVIKFWKFSTFSTKIHVMDNSHTCAVKTLFYLSYHIHVSL